MTCRVPVLGQHDMGKALRQAIDDRNDVMTARNREIAAGAEIILHIDDQQYIAIADVSAAGRTRFAHDRPLVTCRLHTIDAPACCPNSPYCQ